MKFNNRHTACMLGYFIYNTDSRVQNYVKFLTNNMFSVDVICLKGKEVIQEDVCEKGVSIFAIRDRKEKEKSRAKYIWNNIVFFIHAMYKVSILYLTRRYKIVHIHNVPDFLVFTAWVPKFFGSKIILDIHDILPELYARKFNVSMNTLSIRFLLSLEKLACKFANHVIIANDIWKDRIIERSANEEKCSSIINFPDTALFPPRKYGPVRFGKNHFKIIYHGSITEHHGLDIAIKAIGLLRYKIGNFKFIIYGNGPYESKIRSLICSLNLENFVEIREMVPYVQVPGILRNADIGVVPKKDGIFVGEALSTKLFQYVAMKIPAVVSRTEGEMRYFSEEEVKFFVPEDPQDMARCIQELYEDPELRILIAEKAFRKIDKYNLDIISKRYMDIVNMLRSIC